MDRRIDILLSMADFFKIAFIALWGVFGYEWLRAFAIPAETDGLKIVVTFFLGALAGLAMCVCWWLAKKLTRQIKNG